MNDTYTKIELVCLATTHHDIKVREAAAESLYARGVRDGGLQIIEVRQRALAPMTDLQVQS